VAAKELSAAFARLAGTGGTIVLRGPVRIGNNFVAPAHAAVGCSGCHTGNGPYDLADLGREAGGAFRVERRLALLERARARVGELGALAHSRRASW
jgi:hypothetical protein